MTDEAVEVAACVLASRCVWYLLWYMVYCHHIVADTIWGACVHINRFESLTVRTKSWKGTTLWNTKLRDDKACWGVFTHANFH